MPLPDSFLHRMQVQLSGEFPAFLAALQSPPPVSIRLHPLKKSAAGSLSDPVPWHPEGRYLPERPVFTLDPLFHAGAFYVQEASSMFLREALRQTLDFSKKLRVLDLCAAPGGKTTLLASSLGEDSLLVANEVIQSRLPALRQNVEKWGFPNVALSHHDPGELARLEGFFDLVVVDAPCSGEGLFRKDAAAAQEWSEQAVQACAARQRRILGEARRLVKLGGVLAYSTCTFNAFENEENLRWLLSDGSVENIPLKAPVEWGVVEKEFGLQFYPHRLRGEGFFIACLRKKEAPDDPPKLKPVNFRDWQPMPAKQVELFKHWLREPERLVFFQKPKGEIVALSADLLDDCRLLEAVLKKRSYGAVVGELKNKDFIPSHALALSLLASADLPAVELDRAQALQFLKKENSHLAGAPKGWLLARFQGLNLGWMKVLDNRTNNYLPAEWRIRMRSEE